MSSKPPLPIYIDSTMLTTWKSCQKKFEYTFLHNLRPPGKSIHLVAGAAFAAGLEAARIRAFDGTASSVNNLLEAAFVPFTREWGDFEAEEDAVKSFHSTFQALEYYLHHHHPVHDVIQPMFDSQGKPLVEFSFAIPLPVLHPSGDPFIFVGRFDLLGKFNDLPCIVDEKTTGALGASWAKQFDLRGQFLGYAWACQQLGYKVNHVFARGIALRKYAFEVLTVPKQYPDWLLERWFEQTCLTLNQITVHYEEDLFIYNFGDACSAYFGCGYTSLCEARDATQWFETFEKSTWSPIKGELP